MKWQLVIINVMQQTLIKVKPRVPVGAELGPVEPQLIFNYFLFQETKEEGGRREGGI